MSDLRRTSFGFSRIIERRNFVRLLLVASAKTDFALLSVGSSPITGWPMTLLTLYFSLAPFALESGWPDFVRR
jgi:hypothetical protein